MLHACAARFDVTYNLKIFWELNQAILCNYIFQLLLGVMIRKTNVESLISESELQLRFAFFFHHYP